MTQDALLRRLNYSSGPGGTRTHNLRIKSPQLCQLSYRPRPALAVRRFEQV